MLLSTSLTPGRAQFAGNITSPWMPAGRPTLEAPQARADAYVPSTTPSPPLAPTGAGRSAKVAAAVMLGLSVLGAFAPGVHAAPLAPAITQTVQAGAPVSSVAALTRAQREALVDSMIVRDAKVGAPDAGDVKKLKDALAGVDTEILQFARQHGTRYVIVKEGQDIADAGVLRVQEPAAVLADAVQATATAQAALREARAKFAPRIAAITGALTKLGALPQDLGGPGPDAALSRGSDATVARINALYADLRGLQSDERATASTLLEGATNDRVKLYNPAEGEAGNTSEIEGLKSLNTRQTPQQMARMHGARTAEEIQSFTDAIERLNADQLPALRQDGPQLDPQNQMILVPNLYYYRANSRTVTVDYHDYATLEQWNDAAGRIKHVDGRQYAVSAEHFDKGGMNTIVIRNTALTAGCAVHELGHSVESILKNTSPEFSLKLAAQKEAAYQHPGPRGFVTDYAGTSASENLSEGFAMHYNNPKVLLMKDPGLARLVDSEVTFIKSQPR